MVNMYELLFDVDNQLVKSLIERKHLIINHFTLGEYMILDVKVRDLYVSQYTIDNIQKVTYVLRRVLILVRFWDSCGSDQEREEIFPSYITVDLDRIKGIIDSLHKIFFDTLAPLQTKEWEGLQKALRVMKELVRGEDRIYENSKGNISAVYIQISNCKFEDKVKWQPRFRINKIYLLGIEGTINTRRNGPIYNSCSLCEIIMKDSVVRAYHVNDNAVNSLDRKTNEVFGFSLRTFNSQIMLIDLATTYLDVTRLLLENTSTMLSDTHKQPYIYNFHLLPTPVKTPDTCKDFLARKGYYLRLPVILKPYVKKVRQIYKEMQSGFYNTGLKNTDLQCTNALILEEVYYEGEQLPSPLMTYFSMHFANKLDLIKSELQIKNKDQYIKIVSDPMVESEAICSVSDLEYDTRYKTDVFMDYKGTGGTLKEMSYVPIISDIISLALADKAITTSDLDSYEGECLRVEIHDTSRGTDMGTEQKSVILYEDRKLLYEWFYGKLVYHNLS